MMDHNETAEITIPEDKFKGYIAAAAEEGGKKALEMHSSTLKCGGCYVPPETFPGDPEESTKECLREHAEDHRWLRFWRKVSDATVFRLASMLVIGIIIAAVLGVGVAIKYGGLKP